MRNIIGPLRVNNSKSSVKSVTLFNKKDMSLRGAARHGMMMYFKGIIRDLLVDIAYYTLSVIKWETEIPYKL